MNVSAELAELSRTIDTSLLGRRIRAARVAAGLTQTQLAAPDASTAYLSRIESGDRRPDLKLLVRFAERANVSLEQFIVGVNTDQRVELTLDLDHAAIAIAQGDGGTALDHLDRARAALSDSPAPDLWPQLRVLEARANRLVGNLDDAIIALEDLVDRGPGGPYWLAASLTLTQCYLESGDPNRCIETGERVLDVLAARGLAAGAEAAEVATPVTAALLARGDHDRAVQLGRATVDSSPESAASQLRAYLAASAAERSADNVNLAAAFAAAARIRAEHAEAQAVSARFHAHFAEILLAGPEPDLGAVRERLEIASAFAAQQSSEPLEAAAIQLSLAKVLVLERDFDSARHALPREEDLIGSAVLVATRLLLLGQIQRGTQENDAARDTLAEATLVLRQAERDRTTAQIWYELGALFDELGDKESSGEAYRQAARATGLAVARPDRELAVAKRN